MFSDIFFTRFHDFLLSVTEKRASPRSLGIVCRRTKCSSMFVVGGKKIFVRRCSSLFVDVRRCSSWVALVAGTCSSMFVDEHRRTKPTNILFVDEPKMFICTLCLGGGGGGYLSDVK